VAGKEETDKALQDLQHMTTTQMANSTELQKLKTRLRDAYDSIKSLNDKLARYEPL
jgi:predicted S18 family serine protease